MDNPVNAEESPFHPFGLMGDNTLENGYFTAGRSWDWIDSNDGVALNEPGWGDDWPSGGIILAVKPGFRVQLRIESNANNAFNGIEAWAEANPVDELGGGVISNNGNIGFTDRVMTIALAKGDFLYAQVNGEGTIPDYVSSLSQVSEPFMLGINRVRQRDSTAFDSTEYLKGDFMGLDIFSMPSLGDDVRVYLEEVQYVPGEENMFILCGETAIQGIAGGYDDTTGTSQATRPHESGLVAQTFTIGEQLNYKIEVLGEPTYESETSTNWIYVWWVLVNGTKKDGAYEDKAEAVAQAKRRWEERPPEEDDITPDKDYTGAVVVVIMLAAIGFGIWFTIKAVGKE